MLSSASTTLLRRAAASALPRAAAPSLRTASAALGAVRNLNLHEYQSAQIMREQGVTVPFGIAAKTVEDAVAAAAEIGDDEVVIKSQILAGGRGLGAFKDGPGGEPGLKGGVHICAASEVADYAGKMLGGTLVTKQSGEAGKPVNTVLIAKKMSLAREFYFAIMMDRASGGPIIIACSEGGTSIEDLAEKFPEKIIKVPVDLAEGLTPEKAMAVVDGLTVSGDKDAAADQIRALYDLFVARDCTMVEVNPLAEDVDGNLIAADAKIGFDDNAEFRQKDVFVQRDLSQEDSREVEAGKVSGPERPARLEKEETLAIPPAPSFPRQFLTQLLSPFCPFSRCVCSPLDSGTSTTSAWTGASGAW